MPSPITQQAPFYSDQKQMQLPIRGLGAGDTLEWQARVVQTKAEILGEFWGQENFSHDMVTLNQTLELRVPKNTLITVWSPSSKPIETLTADQRVFHWVASQTKPTIGAQADAEKKLKSKQIWTADQELDAKQGKLPDVAWTTFKNWQEVGAWYQGLERGRAVPDTTITAKVAELTTGRQTDQDKAGAIYNFVATQIRYIGVAFGIGRYQPHTAQEVLENQYGDCKDKYTLLAAMLQVIGLQPDAVLVGTGIRFNKAVPSPASFNHLIAKVFIAGQPVWLDPTMEGAPFGALHSVIRDKECLTIPPSKAAILERTPISLPFPSFQKWDAVGTLDKDGTSNSRIVLTMRGDDAILLRTLLRQISPAMYDQLIQRISQSMGYAGTTSHGQINGIDDSSKPLKISYDYEREKGGDWANLKVLPQVSPVGLPTVDEANPPVQSISLRTPRIETSTAAIKLPDGWGVILPDAIHANSAYATYDKTYRFEKGALYTERRVEILQEKVPVSNWKVYKKWTDAIGLENQQYIQLIKH